MLDSAALERVAEFLNVMNNLCRELKVRPLLPKEGVVLLVDEEPRFTMQWSSDHNSYYLNPRGEVT